MAFIRGRRFRPCSKLPCKPSKTSKTSSAWREKQWDFLTHYMPAWYREAFHRPLGHTLVKPRRPCEALHWRAAKLLPAHWNLTVIKATSVRGLALDVEDPIPGRNTGAIKGALLYARTVTILVFESMLQSKLRRCGKIARRGICKTSRGRT